MASRKGIPNKNKAFLMKRLKEQLGDDFDPVINAAKNAARMQKIADEAERMAADNEFEQRKDTVSIAADNEFKLRKDTVSAWEKVAQYVEPKLKAIEVDVSGEIEVNDTTDAERAARVASIFDRARERRAGQLDS